MVGEVFCGVFDVFLKEIFRGEILNLEENVIKVLTIKRKCVNIEVSCLFCQRSLKTFSGGLK